MGSKKCKYCGLTNFANAPVCKRCGNPLLRPDKKRRRPRMSLGSLLIIAAAVAFLYYSYGGFQQSLENVSKAEAEHLATQTKDNPNGLSRSEYERQRANQYGTAVQNSNSLNESQRHHNEIENAMRQAEGAR